MTAATGHQYPLELETGGRRVRAVVAQLAAALRGLEVDGTALTEPYPETMLPPGAAGIVLVPWPNRIRSGRWPLDGVAQQLDITEPKTGNASHGLLRNTGYTLLERERHRVLQGATIFPQHGYPFVLHTTVQHELVADGLVVTHTLRHEGSPGDPAAPVAVGAHPYLRVGDVPSEDLVLRVAASERYRTDEHLIPVAAEPVVGTEYDLAAGRRIGDLALDDGFGGVRGADGVLATVTAPDGRAVQLWGDEAFTFLQVYTPTAFPAPEGPRRAVALEPMTAPADAFNSGTGLHRLAPGQEWRVQWGIRLIDAG